MLHLQQRPLSSTAGRRQLSTCGLSKAPKVHTKLQGPCRDISEKGPWPPLRHQQRARTTCARPPAASSDGSTSGEQDEAESDAEDEGDDEVLPELSQPRHVILEEDFLEDADKLRSVFVKRFEDPRKTTRERFLWDYWHVPNQYTLIRTQAQAYFPPAIHEELVDALITYGETRLGCRGITPIWMSYYIDGCCQELHCDSYHGPFAFVLSLTPWDTRTFTGGETMLLKQRTLDFWRAFDPRRGLELTDLVTLVPPRYNQLTVFDPRFPHGVRPVAGTKDPLQARLVLHGWFTEPAPFFEGALDEQTAADALDSVLEPLLQELAEVAPVIGTLSIRFKVSGADGSVSDINFLADTLVAVPVEGGQEAGLPPAQVRAAVQHMVVEHLEGAVFPACTDGDTFITLPLVFE